MSLVAQPSLEIERSVSPLRQQVTFDRVVTGKPLSPVVKKPTSSLSGMFEESTCATATEMSDGSAEDQDMGDDTKSCFSEHGDASNDNIPEQEQPRKVRLDDEAPNQGSTSGERMEQEEVEQQPQDMTDDTVMEEETTEDDGSIPDNGKRRRSILKQSSVPILIDQSRRAWKTLPAPSDHIISRSESMPLDLDRLEDGNKQRRSIRFRDVQIRSYEQTVGDNPSVSYGPPISLDWGYEQHTPICINHYEESRGQRRSLRQMVLSYYHRRNVLTWQYGLSEEELREAKLKANKIKRERSFTNAIMPLRKMEEILESAKRKMKRIFGGRS